MLSSIAILLITAEKGQEIKPVQGHLCIPTEILYGSELDSFLDDLKESTAKTLHKYNYPDVKTGTSLFIIPK